MVRELAQLSRVGAFGQLRKSSESIEHSAIAADPIESRAEIPSLPQESARTAVRAKKACERLLEESSWVERWGNSALGNASVSQNWPWEGA